MHTTTCNDAQHVKYRYYLLPLCAPMLLFFHFAFRSRCFWHAMIRCTRPFLLSALLLFGYIPFLACGNKIYIGRTYKPIFLYCCAAGSLAMSLSLPGLSSSLFLIPPTAHFCLDLRSLEGCYAWCRYTVLWFCFRVPAFYIAVYSVLSFPVVHALHTKGKKIE